MRGGRWIIEFVYGDYDRRGCGIYILEILLFWLLGYWAISIMMLLFIIAGLTLAVEGALHFIIAYAIAFPVLVLVARFVVRLIRKH